MSNLGINSMYATAYQYAVRNQQTKEASSTGFLEKLNDVSKNNATSFKDMWQSKFPGAYYHVMDASKISQGTWERNDFPLEKFFADEVDSSILNWKPSGFEITEKVKWEVPEHPKGTTISFSIPVPYTFVVNGISYNGIYELNESDWSEKAEGLEYNLRVVNLTKDGKIKVEVTK